MKIEHMLGWAIIGAIALGFAISLDSEKVKKRIDGATSFVIALAVLAILLYMAIALLRA